MHVHLVSVQIGVDPDISPLVERTLDFFLSPDSLVKLGPTGTQCQPGFFTEEDLPVFRPLFDFHAVVQHIDLYAFDSSHDELRTAIWMGSFIAVIVYGMRSSCL